VRFGPVAQLGTSEWWQVTCWIPIPDWSKIINIYVFKFNPFDMLNKIFITGLSRFSIFFFIRRVEILQLQVKTKT